jgi:hypothetical protein
MLVGGAPLGGAFGRLTNAEHTLLIAYAPIAMIAVTKQVLRARHAGTTVISCKPSVQRYRNLSGDSGVTAYEIGVDYIVVQFRGGRSYRYSHAGAGQCHVERMQELAVAGHGLSTYISQHVHDRYDR